MPQVRGTHRETEVEESDLTAEFNKDLGAIVRSYLSGIAEIAGIPEHLQRGIVDIRPALIGIYEAHGELVVELMLTSMSPQDALLLGYMFGSRKPSMGQ